MQVSIAGRLAERGGVFSAQVGDVVDVPDALAKKWVEVGHGVRVSADTALTADDANQRDIDAEECLTRQCLFCERMAKMVYRNQPLCYEHYGSAIYL